MIKAFFIISLPKKDMTKLNRTDVNSTKIYVLPTLEIAPPSRLRLFFLPDGNERAKRLPGKLNYNDGGKNVVKMIMSLCERDDIDTAIFGIMSEENITKRDDIFFQELYTAFLGLAVGIETEGIFINQQVQLDLCGDLELLKAKSPMAAKLADMIHFVISKTQNIQNPRLKVKFGINYGKTAAIDENIDIIFRSGMESRTAFRSSGLLVKPKTTNYAFEDLWPLLNPLDVHHAIDEIKQKNSPQFTPGHHAETIKKILETHHQTPSEITVPTLENIANIQKLIGDVFKNDPALHQYVGIGVYTENGEEAFASGLTKSSHRVNVIPAAINQRFHQKHHGGYNILLAPGQNQQKFVIPESPEIGYATIIGCEAGPTEIQEGIKKSLQFNLENKPLLGAKRGGTKLEQLPALEKKAEFVPYFAFKKLLKNHSDFPLEKVAATIFENQKISTEKEKYNIMADLFVGKMLVWAEKNNIGFEKERELQGFVNYVFTCFFLIYTPNHPQWKNLKKNWEKTTEILCIYMEIIYLMDDRIYDAEFKNPETKNFFMKLTTSKLTAAIKKIPLSNDSTTADEANSSHYQLIETLTSQLQNLNDEVEAESSPQLYQNWQNDMVELIEAHANEWEKDNINNTLLQKLYKNYDKKTKNKFIQKYIEHIPSPSIKQKMIDLVERLGEVENVERTIIIHELNFYIYLSTTGASIGAKPVYSTIAAFQSQSTNIPPQALVELEEIYFLTNVFYRLANDLAEINRHADDRENNYDATKFIIDKHLIIYSESEAMVKSLIQLQKILTDLREQIVTQRNKFLDKYSDSEKLLQLGTVIVRSDIVALFYKGTHYRTAQRHQVELFFEKLYTLGVA